MKRSEKCGSVQQLPWLVPAATSAAALIAVALVAAAVQRPNCACAETFGWLQAGNGRSLRPIAVTEGKVATKALGTNLVWLRNGAMQGQVSREKWRIGARPTLRTQRQGWVSSSLLQV